MAFLNSGESSKVLTSMKLCALGVLCGHGLRTGSEELTTEDTGHSGE
jgi:hypothetical protein